MDFFDNIDRLEEKMQVSEVLILCVLLLEEEELFLMGGI